MDSPNISDFALNSGPRLLSESSLLPGSSSDSLRTGRGGDDLSLSELSLADRPHPGPVRRRPFSLLAPPPDEPSIDDDDPEDVVDHTVTQEDVEKAKRLSTKTTEEKLRHDLFILKKLNSAFEVYKEALRETKSSTERVATQLEHTNALLDKYVKILSQSEDISRLITDERWQGAEADEEVIEREHLEALERARREEQEQERALAAQRERLKREQQERKEQEERERLARERAEASRIAGRGSGVRGVRGTRASTRGTRGLAYANGPSTRGARGGTLPTATTKRPTSSASTRGASTAGRGVSRRP